MSAKAMAKLPPIQRSSPPPPMNLNAVDSPRSGTAFKGLHGPTYQLKSIGDGAVHRLPEPQSLKPFVDTKAGSLDTWPAHATAQAAAHPSLPSSQRQRMSSSDEYRGGMESGGGPHQAMVPKPKFLEQLEVFLKKELRNVEDGKGGPSETRLQVFREVFEYLIEDFKAYKPIFSAIKNEYEVMLSHHREKIRELEPLKSMLVTVSEQCDQKIMAMREEERQEMRDLKAEKLGLLQRIESMKEEHYSLQMQIEKLQDKIAEQYQLYRDECDARKLLVSDINDLRYQHEDYQKAQGNQGDSVPAEAKEDPVKMKIALKKAREDLTDATQRLNEMIANYGDVVPRRDFEFLTADHQKLKEEHETLNGDYKQLMAEHEALLDVNQQIIKQRDDFYQELENLKRSATPRPDWDRCAEVLEGGEERWQQISANKKSDELVTLLLKEIMGEGEGYEYFEPKGLGDDVPVYMRFEGKLRKRKMERSEAGILIKEIWREKTKHNQERGDAAPDPLDIFLAAFMRQKYPEEKLSFEWTYTLMSILDENEDENNQLALFKQILTGEMDEDVYHDQLQVLADLLEAFKKADEEEGGSGSFNKDILEHALREHYPLKDDDSIDALVAAAIEELKPEDGTTMQYQELFTEEEDGTVGPFITKLRIQAKEEKLKYVEEIRRELDGKDEVQWREVQMAINVVDAEIDRPHIVQYVSRAFDVPQDQISTAEPVPLDVIVRRLQKSTVRRIGALNSSELT